MSKEKLEAELKRAKEKRNSISGSIMRIERRLKLLKELLDEADDAVSDIEEDLEDMEDIA